VSTKVSPEERGLATFQSERGTVHNDVCDNVNKRRDLVISKKIRIAKEEANEAVSRDALVIGHEFKIVGVLTVLWALSLTILGQCMA
jgi:hypothetical protein